MYTERELAAEMYGDQSSEQAWKSLGAVVPPSPDRHWVNLGQPLEQLSGCPSPEAVAAMFAIVRGKGRKALARRLFGKRKTGPKG